MDGSGLRLVARTTLLVALPLLALRLSEPPAESASAGSDAARESLLSVAAQRGTPTSTPRPGLEPIRGPRGLEVEATATSAPERKPEIMLPGPVGEPTATRQPEPPEICTDKQGSIHPCDQPGPQEPGDDGGDEGLTGCVMVIDVLSGDAEQVSEECEEFADKLPGGDSGNPTSSGNAATSGGSSAAALRNALLPGKRIVGLKTFTAPADLVALAVNATIGQVKVHVDRGENASSVVFPSSLGIAPLHFTVADLDWDAEWWHPAVSEYPNDIDSTQVGFRLENATDDYPRGFLRLVVNFEEDGEEIHGTWHGQMNDMRLSVLLGLQAQQGKVSYSQVRTEFDFDLDMIGIPDWAADPIFGYSKSIEQTVEDSVNNLFDGDGVRSAFSNRITGQIVPFLGPNPVITSARVSDNVLTIRYYNQ